MTLQTPTFTWPLARESSSASSRISLHSQASAAIARLRRRATDSATLLRELYEDQSLDQSSIARVASVNDEGGTAPIVAMDNGHPVMADVMLGEHMRRSLDPDESFKNLKNQDSFKNQDPSLPSASHSPGAAPCLAMTAPRRQGTPTERR